MRRILLAILFLLSCGHARFDWQLPIESCYDDAIVAAKLLYDFSEPSLATNQKVRGASFITRGTTAVVFYNRKDLWRIQEQYGRDAVVGIFAHEVGHAIDKQRGINSSESDADVHAGCFIGILGRNPEPLKAFFRAESRPSATHPKASVRNNSVEKGYLMCKRLWGR